jgi:RNA polymerase sigma-70 factor (ECF subfamily)
VSHAGDSDDAIIVSRCLAGDTAAFETIVARYQRPLFSVAVRMLGNRDDASDATQTAFVRAFERLDTYRPEHRFFSWIYRILANECLNAIRGRRPQTPITEDVAEAEGPLERLELVERRRAVQSALMSLQLEYREVVVLRHFAGLSYEEIGAAIGVPAKTVKSRLYTARQQLGERLLGWGVRR